MPDILAKLAANQMHTIQTSGNCIRNTTTDPYAGIHAEELPTHALIAKLSANGVLFHPEFAFCRKFKIAVIGTRTDRAATQVHDIGLHLVGVTAKSVLRSLLAVAWVAHRLSGS